MTMPRLIVSLLLLSLCACSSIRPGSGPIAAQRTVLGVASEYIAAIVHGQTQMLQGMVLWSEYLDNQDDLTRAGYYETVKRIKGRWKPEEHPLLNLDVVEIGVDTNEAVVVLRKAGSKRNPEIEIELFWAGSGWIVTDDSLFGDDGLLTELLEED